MSKKYAMERATIDVLRSGRAELFAYARQVRDSEALRDAREQLMAMVTVNVTPDPRERMELEVVDGVAQIPILGQLTPSADPCAAFAGLDETEYGFIRAALSAAESDPSVESIALNIDSPGGYIGGLDETAQAIAAVGKPVVAYVSNMAASAAYWLASQADRIVAVSPAAQIGSIGVALEEFDNDAALAAEGIAHRVYTSTDAPDKRPDTKTESGQAKVIAELDALHGVFVRRVAEGRGVSEEVVNRDFGRGGLLIAEEAMAKGMIDEVLGSHLERNVTLAVGKKMKAAGPITKEVNMTQEDIDALRSQAFQDGIAAERKRVAELSAWKGISADADRVVSETIASGKSYSEVAPQLAAAVAKGATRMEGENAPTLQTGTPKGAAGVDQLSAEDMKAAKLMGMTADEFRKYSKEA